MRGRDSGGRDEGQVGLMRRRRRRRREDWLAVIWIRVNDCVCAAYEKEKRARVGAMGLGIRHSMYPEMRLIVAAEYNSHVWASRRD